MRQSPADNLLSVPGEGSTWWTRPCGGKDVLQIALPLIISTGSWSILNFFDRMFLLWHSTQEMAAAMPAGIFHFLVICGPLGLAMYTSTFVAQYKGANQPARMGATVWHGARIGLYATPIFLATIPLAPFVFQWAKHDPDIIAYEVLYYQVLTFGAGANVAGAALSAFYIGRGDTRVVMVVSVATNLFNVLLDYTLIFGKFGLPELGIEGAAWATVIALWFRLAAYGWLFLQRENRKAYALGTGRRLDFSLARRMAYYGGPQAMQLLINVSAFSIFILLVGSLGKEAMAATTIAFNVDALAFVPMIGLGMAVSTLVGQKLGSDDAELAARATWTAFVIALVYMGALAVFYLSIPDVFLAGYKAGTSEVNFKVLRDTVVVLLRFVAIYAVFDAMNVIFSNAIKGAGDTRFVLIVSIVTSPMPVLIAWIGLDRFGAGLLFCWCVITGWVWMLGTIYLLRFLRGKWREMRVIEPDLLVDDTPQDEAVPRSTVPMASTARRDYERARRHLSSPG
jgi:MATE family multidrug resistance protein